MTDLKPQLFRCLQGYSKDRFLKDLTAGVIVAIIAPAALHCFGSGLWCISGTGPLYSYCGWILDLCLRRE